MYKNRNKLVFKLETTSLPAGWRKDANYILGTKQIGNIVHQCLHTLSIPFWGLPFPCLPAETGTTFCFLLILHDWHTHLQHFYPVSSAHATLLYQGYATLVTLPVPMLYNAVLVECYFTVLSRVSILCIILLYSLLYTTAHLQILLIPKTILIYNNDE